jgi:tetratricopeptide (TPR) repeat protein
MAVRRVIGQAREGPRWEVSGVAGIGAGVRETWNGAAVPYHLPMPSAELAYLFRHALLRDAAYQLHLPAARARLHGLALVLVESLCGGRAPEPPPLRRTGLDPFPGHASDPFSEELADHARRAGAEPEVLRLYTHRAAEHAWKTHRLEASARLWIALAGLSDLRDAAEAWRSAGATNLVAGRMSEALPLLEKAVTAARASGESRLEARALNELGGLYREQGKVTEAERHFEEAGAALRNAGDAHSLGVVLANLANLQRASGKNELAERTYAACLESHRASGQRGREGRALGTLGILYAQTGRLELAELTFEDALAIHREVGDSRYEGVALSNLAHLYLLTGRVADCARALETALRLIRDSGDRRSEGQTLMVLASLHEKSGCLGPARATTADALAIHVEVGNRSGETECRGMLERLGAAGP